MHTATGHPAEIRIRRVGGSEAEVRADAPFDADELLGRLVEVFKRLRSGKQGMSAKALSTFPVLAELRCLGDLTTTSQVELGLRASGLLRQVLGRMTGLHRRIIEVMLDTEFAFRGRSVVSRRSEVADEFKIPSGTLRNAVEDAAFEEFAAAVVALELDARYENSPLVCANRLPYEIERASYHYKISADDAREHEHTVTFEIRALRDRLRFVECRYSWSGAGEEYLPEVLSPGHMLHGPVINDQEWCVYLVYLGRGLAWGEKARVVIRQRLVESKRRMRSYVRKTVHEPIDELFLRVSLPASLRGGARCTVEDAASGRLAAPPTAADVVDSDCMWTIRQPRIGWRYAIEWDSEQLTACTLSAPALRSK